ncbi:hypothetical protein [Gluconobacter japonicus]|uniref:hypothetical protein n=1 Tax=Gluconobacter japonicus TaxID=376620 RepID=UPI0039ECAA73
MFDAFGIRNLYASAQFGLQDGQRNYKYHFASHATACAPYTFRFESKDDVKATSTRGEIGKGFLLFSESLLLTAGGDYSYTHRAQADASTTNTSNSIGIYSWGSLPHFQNHSSSLSNDVTLHAGLAYQF